jgi:hypothetical protein
MQAQEKAASALVPRPPAGPLVPLDCGARCPPLGAHPVVALPGAGDADAPPTPWRAKRAPAAQQRLGLLVLHPLP